MRAGRRRVCGTVHGWSRGDERTREVRFAARGSASDAAIADKRIYPYSVLPLPAYDLAVSTTTDMDENNVEATSEWVQFWRVVRPEAAAKPAGLRRDHAATSISSPESRACWRTAQSIDIHTFKCGLYLVRGVERLRAVDDVRAGLSQGKDCGVPVLTGHHWLQTVPEAHAVVSLDISDPEHPREVSKLGWWARRSSRTGCSIHPTGRRVVLNSSGGGRGQPAVRDQLRSGLPASSSLDDRFRERGQHTPRASR